MCQQVRNYEDGSEVALGLQVCLDMDKRHFEEGRAAFRSGRTDSLYSAAHFRGMAWEQFVDAMATVLAGDCRCPTCQQHYDPTNGRACPYCHKSDNYYTQWLKAGAPKADVSWDTAPVLFDTLQYEQFGATCSRCGAILYDDGFCPRCRQ